MTAPISPGYLLIICFSSKPSFLLNATIKWTQSDIGLVWPWLQAPGDGLLIKVDSRAHT